MIPLVGIAFLLTVRSVAPVARLAGDPAFVSRSAKHFGCSREAFVASLSQATFSRYPPGDYTVWLTHRNGLVYPTLQHRDRPTAVLVMPPPARGVSTAAVEAATGNPIEPFRPAEYVVVVTEPAARPAQKPVRTEVLVKVGEEG
jgi:hypothetical protein